MKLDFDGLTILLIILVVVISYRMYKNSDTFQLKCIVSDVDGRKYCVREREKLDAAADRLAEVNQKLVKLVKYCTQNNPNDERCQRLQKKFNPKKVVETLPTSEYLLRKKGEKLAFCLDKKKNSTDNLMILTQHVDSRISSYMPQYRTYSRILGKF